MIIQTITVKAPSISFLLGASPMYTHSQSSSLQKQQQQCLHRTPSQVQTQYHVPSGLTRALGLVQFVVLHAKRKSSHLPHTFLTALIGPGTQLLPTVFSLVFEDKYKINLVYVIFYIYYILAHWPLVSFHYKGGK